MVRILTATLTRQARARQLARAATLTLRNERRAQSLAEYLDNASKPDPRVTNIIIEMMDRDEAIVQNILNAHTIRKGKGRKEQILGWLTRPRASSQPSGI